jgi:hypothetical protein
MGDRRTRPTSELGPSGPVSDGEVLAAVARAERIERRRVSVREIAEHLGWRYSGGATVRLRPPLERLVASGLLDSTNPPRRRIRSNEWSATAAGRRHLATADPVELPESPQHRRWRQDRDVAAWAMDGVRAQAREVVDQAYDLLWERRVKEPITEEEVLRLIRQFEAVMNAFALATRMCDGWPEPSDDARGEQMGSVTRLLPDLPRQQRRV